MSDLSLPQDVAQGLADFVEAAQSALGPDLVSVVLFGSAAEGRMRATSDVNVILVLARVAMVHLSEGRWITRAGCAPRLLDDHLHDVPAAVFALLEALAATVPQALTVILERDGNYPAFDALLGQIERGRLALARGRAVRDRLGQKAA